MSNRLFLFIIALTIAIQIVLVEFAGSIFKVDPAGLGATGWIISVVCGAGSLIVGFLVRTLPPFYIPKYLYADYIGLKDHSSKMLLIAHDDILTHKEDVESSTLLPSIIVVCRQKEGH